MFRKNQKRHEFEPHVKWFFSREEIARAVRKIPNAIQFLVQALTYKREPLHSTKQDIRPLMQRIFHLESPIGVILRAVRHLYEESKVWIIVFLRKDAEKLGTMLAGTIRQNRLRFWMIIVSATLLFFIGDPASKSNQPAQQSVSASVDSSSGPEKQAALYPFHASPFYYGFRTEPTSMYKLEAFSRIGNARHNSHGFRSREYTLAHPPDVFRIVVIGDEVTYGTSVELEETFPSQMELLLNQQCNQTKFEVIALGGLGHRLADNFIKLGVHAQTLNPDLVLFQMSFNDVEFFNYRNAFLTRGGPMEELLPYMRRTLDEVMTNNSKDRKVFRESLLAIQKWSSSHDVAVAVAVFPVVDNDPRGRNFNLYDPKDLRAPIYLSKLPELVAELESTGLPFLDLTAFFREQAKNLAYMAVSIRDASPNSFTHNLAANGIVGFLKRNGLLSCPAKVRSHSDKRWKSEMRLREKASQQWPVYNQQYGEQLVLYKELSELYPDDAWNASLLADVYYGLEQWEDAARMFASLNDLAPEFSAPWYQLAQCSPVPDEKIKLLEQMLRVVPNHNLTIEQLAEYYIRSNRIREACGLLERLLEMPVYRAQYEAGLKSYKDIGCEKKFAAVKTTGN